LPGKAVRYTATKVKDFSERPGFCAPAETVTLDQCVRSAHNIA
jgi:hypothetical protein